MTSKRPFRAMIAGGGVAGLTLANMFQAFDIDYVILEAHNDIAATVGAGIGLMPNGLLILDQLGCYEPVLKVGQAGCVNNSHFRSSDGKSIVHTRDIKDKLEKRHGYPALYLDRQWLLQILFDKLQDKTKIQLNCCLETIEIENESNDGVIVRTKDGKVFIGDILIGADGIHSIVRKEMYRLAEKSDPSYFPPGEHNRARCQYQCSFGTAKGVENWPSCEQGITLGNGYTFFCASGPRDRCYWFFSIKLPTMTYGEDIPRYTKDDELKFAAEHQGLRITENLTFGQLFTKRTSSTLTPVHEVVYEKWYYKRIALVGDAVHKSNPIGGQGGNIAMETCAALVNAINHLKEDRNGGLDGLCIQEIESALHAMESNRIQRAKTIIAESHQMQVLFGRENRLRSKMIWEVIAPLQSSDRILDMMSKKYVGAARLEHLPVPQRPRILPFDFEHPGKSWTASIASQVRNGFSISKSVVKITTKAWRLLFKLIGSWVGFRSVNKN